MFDLGCLIFDLKKKTRTYCAPRTSTINHQQSNIPHQTSPRTALTLIELLVVIVILMTLVAGVIPILSPNNDTRKIREATRMLQTYIMQAQAEAARTGRPQGIAFRESSAGSGVALDVFRLEVPRPFAGFSSTSATRIIREEAPANSNQFNYYLQFLLADTATGITPTNFPPTDYSTDPVPPRLVRKNDSVSSGGIRVLVTDTNGLDTDGVFYIATSKSIFEIEIDLTKGTTLAFVQTYNANGKEYQLTAPKIYKLNRQPSNTSESPIQFPAGIGIDMQGSVVEGATTSTISFPVGSSFHTALVSRPTTPSYQDAVGIMFSPTGSVSSVVFNGNPLTNVSRVALLLGRVENGGLIDPTEWTIAPEASKDALAELQDKINWLNLDSRWLMIAANSGRAVVSDNAFVDTRDTTDNDGDGIKFNADPDEQIEAAHQFAHEMRTAGAGR